MKIIYNRQTETKFEIVSVWFIIWFSFFVVGIITGTLVAKILDFII